MLTRQRFSGAFGADAAPICQALLLPAERGPGWYSTNSPGSAAFNYIRWPGESDLPQVWHSPDGLVTLVADVQLWDAVAVRQQLIKDGYPVLTGSHAELLLFLYLAHGVNLGLHCRGMFVAAVYDQRQANNPQLCLIRDPLGGRGAIYYAAQGNQLAFSSTLRSLRRWTAIDLQPNLATVRDYLTYAFTPGEQTLIQDCYELLPGGYLKASLDSFASLQVEKGEYWHLTEPEFDESLPVEAYATPLRQLLEEAVAERLPASGDVAVLLSGGLDSSAITALANQQVPGKIYTFSINFGAQFKNELPFSSLVSDHCHTHHTILTVSGKEIADNLLETTARLDSPTGDPLTVPNFLLDKAASQVSPVVLNGEGGDPCFGGPKNLPMMLHELYGEAGSAQLQRERNYLRSYQKCYDDLPDLLTPSAHQQLASLPPQEAFLQPWFNDRHMRTYLGRLMNINVRLKGSHQILYKVDRMTAAWGLEGRSPLFDRRVTEFAFTVPPHYKQAGTNEKYVLKKAVWDLLPEPILTRPKSGMLVPVQAWFKGEMKGFAANYLQDMRLARRGIINQGVVSSWLKYEESVFPRHGVKLWLILSLELYLRLYIEAPRNTPVYPRAGAGL